jgi:hypothetical protein
MDDVFLVGLADLLAGLDAFIIRAFQAQNAVLLFQSWSQAGVCAFKLSQGATIPAVQLQPSLNPHSDNSPSFGYAATSADCLNSTTEE